MKINIKKLRELNFGKLISVDSDPAAYSFDEYTNNKYEHTPIKEYCVSCEKLECNVSRDDPSYKLTNISHGAHSCDFFRALEEKPDTTDWHEDPIMFVYESPSKDYGIYEEVPFNGYNKHPSKKWYWIHENLEPAIFPDGFKRGEYGGFVWSAALTFKLANVYMTNLVKCGLNNAEGDFKNLDAFNNAAIENCYSNFLKEEIAILKPKIIFAVGSKVEDWVKYFVKKSFLVQQLPHPAALSFKSDHIGTIYFWHVVKALNKAEIINTDEGCELAKLYLDKFNL